MFAKSKQGLTYIVTNKLYDSYNSVLLSGISMNNVNMIMKIFKKTDNISNEFDIIKKLQDHDNIIKLLDHNNQFTIDYAEYHGFIMEKCTIDFMDIYLKYGKLDNRLIKYYFHKLCESVKYCHKNDIAHLDLKPENMLIDNNYEFKLADFGLSKQCFFDVEYLFGTPSYMAPELQLNKKVDGKKYDVWALGVILFIMTTSIMPWNGNETNKLKQLILDNKSNKIWEIVKDWPCFDPEDEVKDLISKMLIFNPEERCSTEDILKNSWFNNIITKEEAKKLMMIHLL